VLIPSLDLQDGKVVQLVGGEQRAWESDDVFGWAERLSVLGDLAVVDLDAAMGKGDNLELVEALCRRHRCRVGGGVREEDRARRLLKAGAVKLMVGTAATPDLLSKLPRDVWIACLDHRDGIVVDRGWTSDTGEAVLQRAERLAPHVGGFLITAVNQEGRMGGHDSAPARDVANRTSLPVTVAGGVRAVDEVVELHRQGLDAQLGMAMYTGALDPVEAFLACADFERGAGGLMPTFVTDERGRALMLAWSSPDSLREALRERRGVYFSRSRADIWRKGDTSGATQRLLRADLDCDGDALRFTVEQTGGACHTGADTCFGRHPFDLAALERAIVDRADGDGYTAKLVGDPRLARRKLSEEAYETIEAAQDGDRAAVTGEAADTLYHLLALLRAEDISLRDVERELWGRRRP